VDCWIEGHRRERTAVEKKARDVFRGVRNQRVDSNNVVKETVSPSHLLPFFERYTLLEVSLELISRYKSLRLQEGAKPPTLNRELSVHSHGTRTPEREKQGKTYPFKSCLPFREWDQDD